jgi:hypothetical protein
VIGWAFITVLALVAATIASIFLASALSSWGYAILPTSDRTYYETSTASPTDRAATLAAPWPTPTSVDPTPPPGYRSYGPDPYLPEPYGPVPSPTGFYSPAPPPSGPVGLYVYPTTYPEPILAQRFSDFTTVAPAFIGLITAILATIFLVRVRSVTARSRWLGILIGSAIHLIVFGGLCVVIIDTVGT